MATLIDSLLVSLGLDTKDFVKGQKESSEALKKMKDEHEKAAKDLQEYGKKAGEFFGEIKKQALELFLVFLGARGMKDFIEDTINAGASVNRLSKALGVSGDDLEAWKRIAEETGMSLGEMNSEFMSFATSLGEAKIEKIDARMMYLRSHLGTDRQLAADYAHAVQTGDPQELALLISKVAQNAVNNPNIGRSGTLDILSKLGLGGAANFNMYTQGPEELKKKLDEFNPHLGDKFYADQETIANRMDAIGERIKNVFRNIYVVFEPIITRMIGGLERFATFLEMHKKGIENFCEKIANGFISLAQAVDEVADAFGGWDVVGTNLGWLAGLMLDGVLDTLHGIAWAIKAIGDGIDRLRSHGMNPAPKKNGGAGVPSPEITGDYAYKDSNGNIVNVPGPSANGQAPSGTSKIDRLKSLMAMGFTELQAEAMHGNIQQESGWNPNSRNSSSGAYGIGQWLGSRLTALKEHESNGKWMTMEGQLDFMKWELTHSHKDVAESMRKQTDLGRAVLLFRKSYEGIKDGDPQANDEARIRNARRMQSMAAGIGLASANGGGNSVETNINTMHIHTKATDANEMAREVQPAFTKHPMVAQFNSWSNV